MERIDNLLPDAGKITSGSSANRNRRAEALRLDDNVCPHCERELQAEWVEFPPALQKKYNRPGEWYYHPCTPECEQKNDQREWERMRRDARVDVLRQRSGLSKRMKGYSLSSFKPYANPPATTRAFAKVEDYLGDWAENREAGRGLYFCGGVGTGKCVAASEHIHLADGRRIGAADLVDREFELLTLVDGKPTPVKARAEWNAVEPVWELETETGKRVVRNAEHPLYVGEPVSGKNKNVVPRGWRGLASIVPGQVVAAPDALPAFGSGEARLPEDEVKLLAYMIGDGGLTQPTVKFSQAPGAQLEETRAIVERFGARLVPHQGVDYRIVGTESRTSRSLSRSGFTTHRFNRVAELLKRHGLAGKHSREKRIPEAVFGLPRDQLVTFLSRLYATDGWACHRRPRLRRLGTVEIGFCSASEGMVRDVQELLLKLGISARVTKRTKVTAWCLNINDARQVVAFADEVGIFGKEEAVEAAREVALNIRQKGRNREKWRLRNSPEGTHWETVKSVRRLGVEPTVAIEVPDHHTFLTLFWEHNTHLAVAVMNELMIRKRVPSLFVTVPELLDNLRGAYMMPGRDLDEWMEAVKNADLLLLDDLGAEKATQWVQERVFVIVNHRYREALPTIFTSNIGPEKLPAQLGERTASRIISMTEGVKLDGVDYRETARNGGA